MIPIFKPRLPLVTDLLPYLKEIDQNQQYTNNSPVLRRFEGRLADHFGVPVDHICTSANGTLALIQMLKSLNLPQGSVCALPSWTFVASASAVVAAGLTPYFLDVDADTWAIAPHHVNQAMAATDISVVMVVSPFGAPVDCTIWERFQAETGIPVVVDAAAGFDSFSQIQTILPYMVSLHATKVFGVGEGAVIVANPDVIQSCRQWGQFGFSNDRTSHVPGINAKLSEYAAAVGLAGLDNWAETRQSWQVLKDQFLTVVSDFDVMPGFSGNWVSCYGNILIDQALTVSFSTRRWWEGGCHSHPAYHGFPQAELAVTNSLAGRCLGMPYWLGLSTDDLSGMFIELRHQLDRGAA